MPRSVGGFTVNFCRNMQCPVFGMPVSLPEDRSAITTGTLRDPGEASTYRCGSCTRSSIMKSNIELGKVYARLNAR
jgi:hypothetical protein